MQHQVICESPNIIVNPLLRQLLSKYGNYTLGGHSFRCALGARTLHYAVPQVFYEYKNSHLSTKDLAKLDECYVLDNETGETYPVYMAVPCGHCAICRESKALSFVRRCELETQCYDCLPWFFTLTYDNKHLPADGVSVRDCQLFLKRFRINLERKGYNDKIRYCICSEYGKNGTHRPHYHGIFWNLHPTDDLTAKDLQDILHDSWQNGFIQSRVVQPGDNNSFYYTAKYMRKLSDVPEGKNKTFMLSSRKNGGIGAPFLDKIADRVRHLKEPIFKYRTRFGQVVKELVFDRYTLNRIYPSFCRSVNSAFRTACQRVAWLSSCVRDSFAFPWLFDDVVNKIRDDWSQHFFCPFPEQVSLRDTGNIDAKLFQLETDCRYLRKWFVKVIDWDNAHKLAQMRDVFLAKLFMHPRVVDVSLYAYQVKQRQSRAKSLIQI